MWKPGTAVPGRGEELEQVPRGRHPARTLRSDQTRSPISTTSLQTHFRTTASDGARPGAQCNPDGISIRTAHAERSVSLLPCKFQPVLMQPARGVRLQDLDGLGDRHVRWQNNRQMRMVRSAASGEHGYSVVPPDPRKVLPKPGHDFLRNEISPRLGTEDAVDENVGILVSHPPTIYSLSIRVCARCHIKEGNRKRVVPKRDSETVGLVTRHCRAGVHMPCLRHLSVSKTQNPTGCLPLVLTHRLPAKIRFILYVRESSGKTATRV